MRRAEEPKRKTPAQQKFFGRSSDSDTRTVAHSATTAPVFLEAVKLGDAAHNGDTLCAIRPGNRDSRLTDSTRQSKLLRFLAQFLIEYRAFINLASSSAREQSTYLTSFFALRYFILHQAIHGK